ncbi:MAG TPA: hypothetical protein DGX96_08675 [Lachnospiraceae bacterium]|nr:hypothetical protein [Lachnospiraceae bacterium]
MTTKDDSFTASDIDYLESRLIDLAGSAATFDSENKKKGNPQKVDEFRQAELEQYLEEALFVLKLIGVNLFQTNLKQGGKPVGKAISLVQNGEKTIDAKQYNKMMP